MSEPLGGLLATPPAIVAAGVEVFSSALREQGADVTDVDWRPPGFGSADDLAQLALDPRRAGANRVAVQRGLAAGRGGGGAARGGGWGPAPGRPGGCGPGRPGGCSPPPRR